MSAIETAMEKFKGMIGTEIGVSNWIEVDQKTIDDFARVTHDDQWIHVDPERAARETPFGGSIAHGFLSLSLASRFAYDCFEVEPGQVMGINYGFNKLRFLTPVPAGSRLRGRFTLTSVDQRNATQILRETALTVEIEGHDRPALIADWLGMMVFAGES
ncbi:MaoC family dehydratase [Pseudodonghicola flavimaris]|uniref:MaoC family dehydratase n=1 Tax=Pseudodonghicola flavimaris TaxID=3050036 RepID=A0ABT7F0W1_9RHOB|nr:MaoC family dehydratase [Pseudodonghicola flavimaris]MDK3018249.1 MaoC family dehydratase [Pseudodonghicola flavimaris]